MNEHQREDSMDELQLKSKKSRPVIGLVMTGGGARGAYQAGVLKRIGELRRIRRGRSPFRIVAGASAGAVNGAGVAAGNHDLYSGTRLIAEIWANLKAENVYRTDLGALAGNSARWIKDLSFGGFFGGGRAQSLLDASPLRTTLLKHLDFSQIQDNIDRGFLYAATIAATNYATGKAYMFVQGAPGHPIWQKSRRITLSTQLTVNHILASAAIPIVFQPVELGTENGRFFFGDGCLRLTTPLSPVIRLGAEKILAVGVRSTKPLEDKLFFGTHNSPQELESPPLAQVLGVIFNAIFLDHLDADVEHLMRLNKLIEVAGLNQPQIGGEPIRTVDALAITPSLDLGHLAEPFATRLPKVVHYLMAGLGSKASTSYDLMSYLLFDPEFTKALIDVGYRDATEKIDQIEDFLFGRSTMEVDPST